MKYLILQRFAWLPNLVCSISQHNIAFSLVHLHAPGLRELRRKWWLHKIMHEIYTVIIYSRSCFYSSFSLSLIRLGWGLGALRAVPQPKLCLLCHGRSLFHTCASIPGWEGATGGDLGFGPSLWSPTRGLMGSTAQRRERFDVGAGQRLAEQK